MSKVILLVCVVFFATTNALSLGLRSAQSVCTKETMQRIDYETNLSVEKYHSLTNLRGIISNRRTVDALLKPASTEVDNAIKEVRDQISRLDCVTDRYSSCTRGAYYLWQVLINIRNNIDDCQRNATSADGDRLRRIDEVKDRALERGNSFNSALSRGPCDETWAERWSTYEQILKSSEDIDRISNEIQQEQIRINSEFQICIGKYGYDDFKRNARTRLNEIKQCIDDKLGGSVTSGKVG